MPKKLPYGQSNFADMIESGYVYVDKTRYEVFLDRYKNVFPRAEKEIQTIRENSFGINALDLIYTVAANADIPIFTIIDEYDHFANNLIAMGKTYRDEVNAGGLPVSEAENINGYMDIYLQKHPAVEDIKFEYVFEPKPAQPRQR
jgi:cephalosporin hydroxylase